MSCKTEGNFIDFIIAIKDNESLYKGFLACESIEALVKFFEDHHYDVPESDCIKLHNEMKKMGINEDGIPPAY